MNTLSDPQGIQMNFDTKFENEFKESLKGFNQTRDKLKANPESSKLIAKLESMDSYFLYSCFEKVFTGFKTLEEALHTQHVLNNCLFDDLGIFVFQKEINSEIMDKMRNKFPEKNFPKKYEPSLSFDDSNGNDDSIGKWLDQEGFLEYIDWHEQHSVRRINSYYSVKKDIRVTEDFMKYFKTFDAKNMTGLHPDITEHLLNLEKEKKDEP